MLRTWCFSLVRTFWSKLPFKINQWTISTFRIFKRHNDFLTQCQIIEGTQVFYTNSLTSTCDTITVKETILKKGIFMAWLAHHRRCKGLGRHIDLMVEWGTRPWKSLKSSRSVKSTAVSNSKKQVRCHLLNHQIAIVTVMASSRLHVSKISDGLRPSSIFFFPRPASDICFFSVQGEMMEDSSPITSIAVAIVLAYTYHHNHQGQGRHYIQAL